jgi:hypothetical protein
MTKRKQNDSLKIKKRKPKRLKKNEGKDLKIKYTYK